MSVSVQSPSADSSENSTQLDRIEDMAVLNVKKYVKDLLRSRIFLGRYLERRLVDQRIGYRDVVVISAAEAEIKRDMIEALQRLRSVFPLLHWIGITDSNAISVNVSPSLCLWTEIDNQPFGPFWFQVKSIKFRVDEILISLNCIRPITDSYLELEPILTGANKKPKNNVSQVSEVKENLNESISEIKETLKSALTIRNAKEFVTFVFAFIIAIFTGSTAFVNFLGNFILALLRELSILIKNSTPMLLGFLDFLSKIVGGFYILLAMLFKSNVPHPQNKRSLTYHNRMDNSREFD
ncbi:uncharacterized protein LOC123713464 [Pieris brassicae]|uniref:uncharacterized protein LOC123713464 n=1 Tax=Pieris brassicae TaxID=7116 RepID=UPI001E6618B3|nr:uncharacterized protein LOC123713464 [Pieris brassicae]